MGTTLSSEASLTPEQEDLLFLGDRLPFADSEIRLLYSAYQLFQKIEDKQGFLFDWSYSIGANGLFDVLHDKVLPKNFGNALHEAAFCPEGDTTRYHQTMNKAAPSNGNGIADIAAVNETNHLVDDYTRKARLEKFFDGLARCSRRGPTSALTVLFHTVRLLEMSESNESNVETQHNFTADVSAGDRVSAVSFVRMGFLLARATIHLQQPETPINEAALEKSVDARALAHSIVAKAIGQRKRYGVSDDCPHLSQARVELQDILNWAEAVAPMFGT